MSACNKLLTGPGCKLSCVWSQLWEAPATHATLSAGEVVTENERMHVQDQKYVFCFP